MKHSHSLMILPMPGFLYTRMKDLLIDQIQIEGREQVREKLLTAVTNYDSIRDPVIRRTYRLLCTIHTRKELSDSIDQCLSYLVGNYDSTRVDEKDTISGGDDWFDTLRDLAVVGSLALGPVAFYEHLAIDVIVGYDDGNDLYGTFTDANGTEYGAVPDLKSNGVDVFFRPSDKLTHSKVVVIDETHVFIGSHNWTLDSFFKYNETSLYLNSKELADYYIKEFKSRL